MDYFTGFLGDCSGLEYVGTLGKKNTNSYLLYYSIMQRMTLMAMSVYKWEGLPEGIPARFLERELMFKGCFGFYESPDKGLIAGGLSANGNFNGYFEPTAYDLLTAGGTYTGIKAEDLEICENNVLRLPTAIELQQHAYKIYSAEQTLKLNLNALKTPTLITASQKTKLSMMNIEKDLEEYEIAIHGFDQFNADNIKAIDLGVSPLFTELKDYINERWNDFYTFIGINNNPNQGKKERLTTTEVETNNEIVDFSCDIGLDYRQDFANRINSRYGGSSSVVKRTAEEVLNVTSE